eukprot:m.247849 g.247849  ORF g.247849 m.247849 type:complete len:420 (+) comp15540_c0_seq1:74-1333(+)
MASCVWVFACLAALAGAVVRVGPHTLVIHESDDVLTSHTQFFAMLRAEGFVVSFARTDSDALDITNEDGPLYDNVILMCPAVEDFSGPMDPDDLVDFIDNGGNLLVIADGTIAHLYDNLTIELGHEFDLRGGAVLDPVQSLDGSPSSVTTSNFTVGAPILTAPLAQVAFPGVGLRRDPRNPRVLGIASASKTAYTKRTGAPASEHPFGVGTEILAVGALQALNGARAVLSGSLAMFSDALFAQQGLDNRQFVRDITTWAFQRRGLLRIGEATHARVDGAFGTPYTPGVGLEYTVVIDEYVGGVWVPFVADDVIVEIVRAGVIGSAAPLRHLGDGKFTTQLRLPATPGVLELRVEYRTPGYTSVVSSTRIVVHPGVDGHDREGPFARLAAAAAAYGGFIVAIAVGVGMLVTGPGARAKKE